VPTLPRNLTNQSLTTVPNPPPIGKENPLKRNESKIEKNRTFINMENILSKSPDIGFLIINCLPTKKKT
jgi:hypothetical protein